MAAPTKYQEVITATNYALTAEDGTPFPVFLRFDGTDDGMATGAIDFTATDKMSVFAGVRKLSDTSLGMIYELSSTGLNAGAFDFFNNSGQYFWGTNGSALSERIAPGFSAPITHVMSVVMDNSGVGSEGKIKPRINGAIPTLTAGGPGGPGNYGNYPLYIGRRSNASLPFLGRIYSLVVVGKTASASEITSTENWVNSRTKAF